MKLNVYIGMFTVQIYVPMGFPKEMRVIQKIGYKILNVFPNKFDTSLINKIRTWQGGKSYARVITGCLCGDM